jgi:hypothetical protein
VRATDTVHAAHPSERAHGHTRHLTHPFTVGKNLPLSIDSTRKKVHDGFSYGAHNAFHRHPTFKQSLSWENTMTAQIIVLCIAAYAVASLPFRLK